MHIQCLIPYVHSNQYGFRCKQSASLQLLAYLDGIYRGLEVSENSVCSLYLDFSKAFDKINHQLLLQKLEALGVTGKLLGLLKSYLIDRQHYVTIGSSSSSTRWISIGVPQGSIHGPFFVS